MPPRLLSPTARGTLFVLGGASCISFAPLFVGLDDAGPTTVVFYRMLWGFLALVLIAIARGDRLVPGKSARALIVLAAFFFTADLACWHQSIVYIGPGLATIVSNFQVFFLALFGVFFLKERMSATLILSIPLALVGLWLVLDINLQTVPPNVTAGLILGLGTAAFYSAYILTLRQTQRITERLSAVANMAVVSLAGMVFSGALALIQDQNLLVPSLRSNFLLALNGVGCQGFGWYLLSRGLPLLPASRAGLLMLIQPTLSFVWDVVLCGRPTSLGGYCGAALALFAISLGVVDRSRTKKADKADSQESAVAPIASKRPH